MRKFLFFVFSFFSVLSFGQNDSIKNFGTVSADRMNVVYRGISNPISISVSNAKSFVATAPGLSEISEGKYRLAPGIGNEVVIQLKITKLDQTVAIEKHILKIKNIDPFMATINGLNCSSCIVELPKSKLNEALISVDNIFDTSFKIEHFIVKFPNGKSILNMGCHFNKETKKFIQKAKIGSEILVQGLRLNTLDTCLRVIIPIKIRIAAEEIPYFQSKTFIKDSLNNLKKERKIRHKKA